MPILTTFLSRTGQPFVIERSYIRHVCLTWWNMCLLSSGEEFWNRETQGFGGYGVYMRFNPTFYNWNSSAWMIEDIFTDFYATDPSGTPITCPDVQYGVQWAYQFDAWILALGLAGNAGITTGQRLESAPPTWYRKFPPDKGLALWQVNDDFPDILYPPPTC